MHVSHYCTDNTRKTFCLQFYSTKRFFFFTRNVYLSYLHLEISKSTCIRLKCVWACVQCQTTMHQTCITFERTCYVLWRFYPDNQTLWAFFTWPTLKHLFSYFCSMDISMSKSHNVAYISAQINTLRTFATRKQTVKILLRHYCI